MPNASAPKAPWVEVWESPQTTVSPGWVSPICGPTTCTMPWPASPIGNSRMPNSAQFLRSVSTWTRLTGSAIGGVDVHGGHVVVLGGEREVGAADRTAGQAQPVEGLRAGHLVHEVQVDVEEVGLALGATHDVGVPDLLGQRARERVGVSHGVLQGFSVGTSRMLAISDGGMPVSRHGTQ